MMANLYIASDHAGLSLKKSLKTLLDELNWMDLGTKTKTRVDYPKYAAILAKKVASHPASLGVLICGSGIGMSIAANKIQGVRAAVVENPVAARLSREHNDANILCLGARFLAPEYAAEIVQAWLDAELSRDERHQKRVDQIRKLES